MSLRFEWDNSKADANIAKHGVSFEEATTVFRDPLASIFDDEAHSTMDELREIIIGYTMMNRLVLVCFIERNDTIRIISARVATRRERRDYEEHRNA